MEVALDISKCAVRDMDVNIRQWAGMHHDCTSDRASAVRPADYVGLVHTAIQSGSVVFIYLKWAALFPTTMGRS